MSYHDLIVVGGGTAGIVGALSAARVGAGVVLVEQERTGGDCLWTGCVPSKALLAAAHRAQAMRSADEVGMKPVEPEIDLGAVMAHVRESQQTLAPEDSPQRLRHEGVRVLHGSARFTGPGRLVVDTGDGRHRLAFRRALLATGSRPSLPPIDGLAETDPLTSDNIWELTRLPERLLVVGGGPNGCELGQAFQRLGSQVTILERQERLLHREDAAVGEVLRSRLAAEGVDVRCGTPVDAVRRHGDGWEIELPDGMLAGDRLLVTTGRSVDTDGIGLDRAGVDTREDGAVAVDRRLRTSNPRIFAAGDVTGPPNFTHVAGHQGATAVANALFGMRRSLDRSATPRVVYTDPEVAAVGATEARARRVHGPQLKVHVVDHEELDRAVVTSQTRGFTKLVAAPDGQLIGATIVSPRAGSSIAEAVALVAGGHDLEWAGQLIHAYPTFGEGVGQAGTEALRARVDDPKVQLVARVVLWAARQVDRLRR